MPDAITIGLPGVRKGTGEPLIRHDDPVVGGTAIERDARELLGQAMGFVAAAGP